ncbi:Tetraacyldisaccharide 4'-kinase [Pseudidiomarina piscicola]|uniref:Tetraacyldisaccharide 4'-kinase n=1 Tax=Pseudidiomarina piscicola TaxID=2614830 RepID=A0A6S6WQX7_9GAMM|nr:tetraacyldisaccharide 4'-kinase [Pseudidiomarina piscicola]CAB0150255.1 Tetraacyldisaccharide 4'-kinase [Pseudidiomarina piscicola]VZT39684.1 Tetraacyldisaccharide 4'-kinase [Pseudomonas aeruginosa]
MKLQRAWYQITVAPILWLLLPLHALFVVSSFIRRQRYRWWPPQKLQVPVVVVGNISVGGTGKTPVTLAIVDYLRAQGQRPAIVSRGYGGKGPFPLSVDGNTAPQSCGDEPRLLAERSGVPVVVAPNRVAAAQQVLADFPDTTVIISDDGLQHYRLARQFEIAVIDGSRGVGNGWRLPIGPLREPLKRLQQVDAVIVNGKLETSVTSPKLSHENYVMRLVPQAWRRVTDNKVVDELPKGRTLALAGIGNPERFFATVRSIEARSFATRAYLDHQQYSGADREQLKAYEVLLMTEKDATKWRSIAHQHCYYLPVTASLPEAFWQQLSSKLASYQHEPR